MEFRILGPLEVVADGRQVALAGQHQRALLAALLLRANDLVPADVLMDALWGDEPPREAANALQYHVSQLRKTIGASDVIVTREPGYLVRIAPNELDLFTFVFFCIYVGALIWVGTTLAWGSFLEGEGTGTPWNPRIWPVKFAIPLAGLLLLLQGIANLLRDLGFARSRSRAS